jgi:membrane protein YdbS with pleckstrin-like domain
MNFSLRPVFVGWITFVCQLPIQLFMTLWAGGFLGGIAKTFLPIARDSNAPFVFFGTLAFILIPVAAVFGKQLNYTRTEYKFFDDRLEFEEGFFTINKKVIKYSNVKEITLRKGIFQRMYGLGTVYLATLATGSTQNYNVFYSLGFGNVSASGIAVRDIENPDETYEKIKKLVDAKT